MQYRESTSIFCNTCVCYCYQFLRADGLNMLSDLMHNTYKGILQADVTVSTRKYMHMY